MRSPAYREDRRQALRMLGAGAAAGVLAPAGALGGPADVAYAINQTLRGAAVVPGPVVLDLPDRSEQGTSVPLTVRVDSPMTVDDHVRAVHVFAGANPRPHVLSAFFTPASGIAEVSTRIRFENPVLDTLLLSAVLHPVHQQHDIENIARRLGVNILGRHTALGDAITTAEIFLKLLPILNSNGILTLKFHQILS